MGKAGKGTGSFGRRHGKTHFLCLRCGRRAYHVQKKTCASCGEASKVGIWSLKVFYLVGAKACMDSVRAVGGSGGRRACVTVLELVSSCVSAFSFVSLRG